MKQLIINAIDAAREDIIACGEYILRNPELGYKEYKTSQLVKDKFKELGIQYESELALTGVKGVIGKKDAKLNICVIGELDAVKCYEHPMSDKETGAAHACGHNAQIANLIGVAYGFVKSGVVETLDAKITLFAVPAEEFVELDFREELKRQGKISYFGGKQELIHLGAFDNIDMAMMIHSQAGVTEPNVYLGGTSLGFETKMISFSGQAAHGSRPWEGVNALNAAMMALIGINANRETFKDEDRIRIHPILTNGGDLVNVIPERAVIETYVRGANVEAIEDACKKVDAASYAGAMAVGAQCNIYNVKGYKPLKQNETITKVFEKNARELLGANKIVYGLDMTGSTDMGDLSHKMPCIHPTIGGFSGTAHGKDFTIVDKESVYITASKVLACTIYDLCKEV